VRELLNVLQQAVALSPNGVVTAEHIRLNDHLANGGAPDHSHAIAPSDAAPEAVETHADAPRTIADAEARHIADLLRRHDQNRRVVATVLGISERTLYRKIKRYQISSAAAVGE